MLNDRAIRLPVVWVKDWPLYNIRNTANVMAQQSQKISFTVFRLLLLISPGNALAIAKTHML